MKLRDYARTVGEVLDEAFFQTPLKGSDLAKKVVREFFVDVSGPGAYANADEHGQELLRRYNSHIRDLNREDENMANAASAARLLGRPDLKDAIYDLLQKPDPGECHTVRLHYKEDKP